jgi:ATP-dependent Clp protease ATP-binding subunit ClpA
VVDKFIFELEQQLEEKKVALTIDQDARRWLAEAGYDPKMGARPMARLIQQHIKKPLANELLFGELVGGGAVRVFIRDGEVAFEINGEVREL